MASGRAKDLGVPFSTGLKGRRIALSASLKSRGVPLSGRGQLCGPLIGGLVGHRAPS